jgi:hypothetical protein
MTSPDLTQARWFTSSHSHDNGACVEVALGSGWVAVRDSKDPSGPALVFHPSTFAAFTDTMKTARTTV